MDWWASPQSSLERPYVGFRWLAETGLRWLSGVEANEAQWVVSSLRLHSANGSLNGRAALG